LTESKLGVYTQNLDFNFSMKKDNTSNRMIGHLRKESPS